MPRDESELLLDLCKRLRIEFTNISLLKKALIHRSYLNEHPKLREHNERLEFLGDAVIELLVSKYLFKHYPDRPEGELTSFRAATVRTESLSDEAKRLELGKYLFMSKGEEKTGGRTRSYILANTFEAVVGAIYLDQGLTKTEKFLRRVLYGKITEIVDNRLDIDAKSKVQEIAQEVLRETPTYEVISAEGPDHAKTFTTKILIKEKDFGHGTGTTKQEAEQNAAQSAIDHWKELIAQHFGID